MFYCDPPGRTDPDSLYNYGSDEAESNYILLHDQEPIHFDYHEPLFTDTVRRNLDLNHGAGATHKAIITSELDSEYVEKIAQEYGWNSYYYFYHGWAALDWYRGYNRTFLYENFVDRDISKTFLFPNNIIGGKRKHRLSLLKELEKRQIINDNYISFPAVCPYENLTASELCNKYNIEPIQTKLPLILDSFDNHASNSHQITLWEQANTSLLQVVSETVFTGQRVHITEKSFKPIVMQQPFVIASCRGTLECLRSYGFETFSSVWDESYDLAEDDVRCSSIADLLADLNSRDKKELQQKCAPIVEHNYNHFFNGKFEQLLWEEFTSMLEQIKNDFCF